MHTSLSPVANRILEAVCAAVVAIGASTAPRTAVAQSGPPLSSRRPTPHASPNRRATLAPFTAGPQARGNVREGAVGVAPRVLAEGSGFSSPSLVAHARETSRRPAHDVTNEVRAPIERHLRTSKDLERAFDEPRGTMAKEPT
jgi:hypothetical protein